MKSTLMAWLESVVITVAFMILAQATHDPLSLESPFPWIWFAPVLVALRYGLWPALFSMILLIYVGTQITFDNQVQLVWSQSLQLSILGGFVLTMVCAMFHQGWNKKILRDNELANYLQQRIQSIIYAYNLLKLAHHRLENQYISKPVTLRTSLGHLKELLAREQTIPGDKKPKPNRRSSQQPTLALADTPASKQSIFDRFLNILALQCSIEIAAIYEVRNHRLVDKPLASIGPMKMPKPKDFLIQSCLQHQSISYIGAQNNLHQQISDYLIVAPMMDQMGQIDAVLLVEDMPFLTLNDETLGEINLLIHYFMQGYLVENSHAILTQYPDCPVDFANELQRLTALQKIIKQDSDVVAYRLSPCQQQEKFAYDIAQEKRGLDSIWARKMDPYQFLLVLMPLSSLDSVACYQTRMQVMFEKHHGISLDDAPIQVRRYQLSAFHDPSILLKTIFNAT